MILGAALIVAGAVALAVWSSSTDYQVLFAQLGEADAANVVEQLKHQKIPYRLADQGTTVKVPAGQVYETRLALVSSGLPLSGGVGFEIFDREGLGASEQSQRIAYQRALQGELARTISALQGVQSARVHLVLPESTMFKRDREEPRAAVSLVLKAGASLSAEQTAGVQRLVAASVSNLDASKVVITDQRGITLSGGDGTEGGTTGSDARLSIKRSIEDYIARKVGTLLDSAYGSGQALVSVDVALNFDQIKSTVQDLVPMKGTPAGPEGAVLRRRQVESGAGPTPAVTSESATAGYAKPSGSTTEVEYEFGRREEQVISAPGSISRLSVGVIVPGDLSDEKRRRITDLVRVAAGINESRGDAVVVQPLEQLGVTKAALLTGEVATESASSQSASSQTAASAAPATVIGKSAPESSTRRWVMVCLSAVGLLAFGLLAGLGMARKVPGHRPPLSAAERQHLLAEMERALSGKAELGVRSTL
jgi:flagellar M-ring protein FliF